MAETLQTPRGRDQSWPILNWPDGRWARVGLALAAGALAALAHPPFGFLPGLLGYPLLMALAGRSASVRGAVWMGWLAGFAYFLIGCWWVAEAFFVNPAQAWMAPFAASLLPAGLGLFWAAAAGLHRRLAAPGVERVLLFAGLFTVMEWLRGHVLTGFPWNPAGAAWAAGSAASQFAAVVGVYGLSLATLVAVCALEPLAGPGDRRRRIATALAGLALLAGLNLHGWVRLTGATRSTGEDAPLVRIVQANVDQKLKWSPEAYSGIVEDYVRLTAQPGRGGRPDIVIWPEGALPATAGQIFAPGAFEGRAIAAALSPGQILLMGVSRGQADPTADDGVRYFNSLLAFRSEGQAGMRLTAVYDKHRLVPFGEYLPLGSLMSRLGVRSLVHVPADFSPGPAPRPIALPGAPAVQPLICYESLYPGFTPAAGPDRPAWIVNVSNDAWFGATSGPVQHLNLARYRAIETGLPMARSTPTGISAMIDPFGRMVGGTRLGSGESGVIDVRLPSPGPVTVYGRWGDWGLGLMLALTLGGGLRHVMRRRRAAPSG